jgi:hypothetical protein
MQHGISYKKTSMKFLKNGPEISFRASESCCVIADTREFV